MILKTGTMKHGMNGNTTMHGMEETHTMKAMHGMEETMHGMKETGRLASTSMRISSLCGNFVFMGNPFVFKEV